MSTKIQRDPASSLAERAGYFPVSGLHLYTVLHEVANPVARVLFGRVVCFGASQFPTCHGFGGLAIERRNKLKCFATTIVVLGKARDHSRILPAKSWMNDVQQLATWFRNRGVMLPLILHGLEMGGILAPTVFHNGEADALILWSAPVNANKVLRSTLQRWIGPQQLLKSEDERRPLSHFFRLLEDGKSVEVEGYEWTPALWQESIRFDLPAAMIPPQDPAKFYRRPVRNGELEKTAAPRLKGGITSGFRGGQRLDLKLRT